MGWSRVVRAAAGLVLVLPACEVVRIGGERDGVDVVIGDPSPTLAKLIRATSRDPGGGDTTVIGTSRDGRRVYAGVGFGGLWRSDDGGANWRQLTQPQPGDGADRCRTGPAPCALPTNGIGTIAVWPSNPDLVFAGTLRDDRSPSLDGLYRSADGGATWRLVHTFSCAPTVPPGWPAGAQSVGQIEFAPDDDTKLWVAGGCGIAYSTLGDAPSGVTTSRPADALTRVGTTWTSVTAPRSNPAWHVVVGPAEARGRRRVHGCGFSAYWYSDDGGRTYRGEGALTHVGGSPAGVLAGGCSPLDVRGTTHQLAIEPGNPAKTYIALGGGSNGRFFFDQRTPTPTPPGMPCGSNNSPGCAQGQLWSVTYSDGAGRPTLTWRRGASPPIYWGAGTISGITGVRTKALSGNRFALFFLDGDTLQVHVGPPTADGWHRLDGLDAAEMCPGGVSSPTCSSGSTSPRSRDGSAIHLDPRSFAFTPDVDFRLDPPAATVPSPYDKTRSLAGCTGTAMFYGTDGGLYRSTDCGNRWRPAENLTTLHALELAGIPQRGRNPALYFGSDDTGNFWSHDGGASWTQDDNDCGDCTGFWADPLQPDLVMHVGRAWRAGDVPHILMYRGEAGRPPAINDPARPSIRVNLPAGQAWSESMHGSRPIVLTMPGEAPRPDGDYVWIAREGERWYAYRGSTSGFTRFGPALPPEAANGLVAAAGGHAAPTLYVASRDDQEPWTQPRRLYRLRAAAPGATAAWECIVPGPASPGVADGRCRPDPGAAGPGTTGTCGANAACRAYNFVAHPYDPDVVYVADYDGIKVTTDGGRTWRRDDALTRILSDGGRISAACRWTCAYYQTAQLLNGMTFVPGEHGTAFAMGTGGVALALDSPVSGGTAAATWFRLLDTKATACNARPGFFDPTGVFRRTLYVACSGRSLLSFFPIPETRQLDALRRGQMTVSPGPPAPDASTSVAPGMGGFEEFERVGTGLNVTDESGVPTGDGPALTVAPEQLELTCTSDELAPFEITIANTGSGTVDYGLRAADTVPGTKEPWAVAEPGGELPAGTKRTVVVTPAKGLCGALAKPTDLRLLVESKRVAPTTVTAFVIGPAPPG